MGQLLSWSQLGAFLKVAYVGHYRLGLMAATAHNQWGLVEVTGRHHKW